MKDDPWQSTPLTARAFSSEQLSFFCLFISFFVVRRWQAAWNHVVPCSARLEASKGCNRLRYIYTSIDPK